jgi:putative peptide zinc metalloprotease protein
MRFGPTSLQLSSVLAKGLNRPKLREDLRISQQQILGETSYVVKVLNEMSYNRYGPLEYSLLKACDGTRTAAEIGRYIHEQDPETDLSEQDVLEFLDGVDPILWEKTVGEKNLAVLERIRDERKSRVNRANLLYIAFKAWSPDKALARLDPYLSWIYTTEFAVISIGLFIVAMIILAGDWNRVARDTSSLYSFAGKSGYDIWAFWVILLVMGGIHEFAHGLTCKHFGGEVPQMGFLLIYFTPAFYTDTTDILIFDTAKPRQFTIFAGIWIELTICSVATIIWAVTFPGSLTNDLAYKVLLLSGIQGALVNLNPLIKADGYYALAQLVQIDSLREDSFEYLRAWFAKYFLRRKVELPSASRRQRRIFLVFGLAAIIYSTTLLILVFNFIVNVFVKEMGPGWGFTCLALGLYLMFRKRALAWIPHIRSAYWKTRETYMRWKMTRTQGAVLAGVALLLFIPPFPSRVTSDFILEPASSAQIRAQVSGELTDLRVRGGDLVAAGETLAVLKNPALQSDQALLQSQLALAESTLREAELRNSQPDIARASAEQTRLAGEFSIASAKVADLTVKAPIDGTFVTSGTPLHNGEFLAEGQELARIANRSAMRARILVRDYELEDTAVGAPVRLKVVPHPFRTFHGIVSKILPAAALDQPVSQTIDLERQGQKVTNFMPVELLFPNPDGMLVEGMTGTAKIGGKNRPIAWQIGRSLWRWAHSQIW